MYKYSKLRVNSNYVGTFFSVSVSFSFLKKSIHNKEFNGHRRKKRPGRTFLKIHYKGPEKNLILRYMFRRL